MVDDQVKGIVILCVDCIKVLAAGAFDLVTEIAIPWCRETLFRACFVIVFICIRVIVVTGAGSGVFIPAGPIRIFRRGSAVLGLGLLLCVGSFRPPARIHLRIRRSSAAQGHDADSDQSCR